MSGASETEFKEGDETLRSVPPRFRTYSLSSVSSEGAAPVSPPLKPALRRLSVPPGEQPVSVNAEEILAKRSRRVSFQDNPASVVCEITPKEVRSAELEITYSVYVKDTCSPWVKIICDSFEDRKELIDRIKRVIIQKHQPINFSLLLNESLPAREDIFSFQIVRSYFESLIKDHLPPGVFRRVNPSPIRQVEYYSAITTVRVHCETGSDRDSLLKACKDRLPKEFMLDPSIEGCSESNMALVFTKAALRALLGEEIQESGTFEYYGDAFSRDAPTRQEHYALPLFAETTSVAAAAPTSEDPSKRDTVSDEDNDLGGMACAIL